MFVKFSPGLWLFSVFQKAEIFNFDEIQFISRLWIVLLMLLSKKSLCKPCSQRSCSPMVSSRTFVSFTFRSVVHFESFLDLAAQYGCRFTIIIVCGYPAI